MQAPYHGVLLCTSIIIIELFSTCTIDSMCSYVHLDCIGQSRSTLNHTWWSAQWNEVILRAVATVLATSQDITLCSIQTYYICNVYIDCQHAQVHKWDIYIIIIYIYYIIISKIMYNLHSVIVLITSKTKARGVFAGVPLSCVYILPPLHTDQWQLNKAYHICSNLRAATKHGAASIWANTVIYM